MKAILSLHTLSIPIFIVCIFSVAYATLSIVRYNHYEAFGFDLGIADQVVWEYSHFQPPLTTIHYYPFQSLLTDHIELIYAPIGVFYWIWSDARMLLLVQNVFFCASAFAIFLLARKKGVSFWQALTLECIYLLFYGVQQALWFDVHSIVFGVGFITWFIYFLEQEKKLYGLCFFLLAILCKENVAVLTFSISFVYFLIRRKPYYLYLCLGSVLYFFLIFGIYFPHFTKLGYEYADSRGLLANTNPLLLIDTASKRGVLFVTFASFGGIPLLAPLYLIPALFDLGTYFVIGNNIKEAQGLFMQYRISLAPLMLWPLIMAIARYKLLQSRWISVYLIICILFFQYSLHLPLSYLTKSWFWQTPSSVASINKMIEDIPSEASIVAQNNITPHMAHRHEIFTLWYDTKKFPENSPCGKGTCPWFRWDKHAAYLLVDTGPTWDIRHFLANREDYVQALRDVEKEKYVRKIKVLRTTTLYSILKS